MNELIFLYQSFSGTESVLKMIGLVLLCVLIIAASYYTTRFVGKKQMGRMNGGNFEVIETFRLSNNKYLQLIRAGERYLVISVSKDSVSLITELDKEELVLKPTQTGNVSFKQVLKDISRKGPKKTDAAFEEVKELASLAEDEVALEEEAADTCVVGVKADGREQGSDSREEDTKK